MGREKKSARKLLGQWDRLRKHQGVLYRSIQDEGREYWQLLLPKALRAEVLHQLHDAAGHQGVERTFALVRKRCYWPGMMKEVEKWCRECDRCTLAKEPTKKLRPVMGNLLASRPLEVLAVDFTVLEPASDGRENVLDRKSVV